MTAELSSIDCELSRLEQRMTRLRARQQQAIETLDLAELMAVQGQAGPLRAAIERVTARLEEALEATR